MKNNKILCSISLCLFALCSNAQESPLQNRFDEQYHELVSEISKRQGSTAELKQVKDVWLDTRKRVIAINAEIDAKKLDASVSSGPQQSSLLDELVAMGGLRERTLFDGISKLQKIQNGGKVSAAENNILEAEPVVPSDPPGDSGKAGVNFKIEPEDVGNSGLP